MNSKTIVNQIKKLSIFIAALLLTISCKHSKQELGIIQKVTTTSSEAVDPYLTKDNNGNAVLCWTEKDSRDSLYRLKYAVYDLNEGAFREPVTVISSAGTRTASESMNKIAFKEDGTIIAIFGKRFVTEKNPYAGAIYYSMSSDSGKSWSNATFLHSDTSHSYGRGFFDITTLKDGEVAAVWLDGRYGKSDVGSALFFARTGKGEGFGSDKCISRNTCECCRTKLLCDKKGNLHIAFRNILFPPAFLGKQVRDMVYTTSKDNGAMFSAINSISADNWKIEGCPHTGPTLAVTNEQVHALWFTAGGAPGLYYSKASSSESNFSPRVAMSLKGKHPQMISLADGRLAMVWEENVPSSPGAKNERKGHNHGKISMHSDPASSAQIILRILEEGRSVDKNITDGQTVDHHPVITALDRGVLLAWVREKDNQAGIAYTYTKLK